MKKVLSVILFVIVVTSITLLTIYTLSHRGERQVINHNINTKPENVGSNMTDNNLSDIYSLYLNNQKHKLKFEYVVTFNKDIANTEFNLYLDGKNVINEEIIDKYSASNIKELFNKEEIKEIRLDLNDFNIVKYDDIEYILIKIKYKLQNKDKEEYFLFNDNGELLINNLLYKDTSINYSSKDNEIYYEDNTLAKFEDNILYSLEYYKGTITEYKYYIKDNELQKEEINKYENIKVGK